MTELVFIGLGLNDDKGITLKGLEETQSADAVFMETYTSRMPDFNMERFEAECGKKVQLITRRDLEEDSGKVVLQAAKAGKAVFLVPGDPFIATTHVTLRIDAEKMGIKTRIVHGISIVSAIVSLSGLHNYKFGKTVTVPFPDNFSETPYNVIAQNRKLGLHTLCLLDLRAAEDRYLSIKDALKQLQLVEEKKKLEAVTPVTVAVGIARAGSSKPTLKAGFVKDLVDWNFGEPPFSLIIPGDLHFMEIDALIAFAGAPGEFRRLAK
ncbi:MAG: diphthine synthase [Candidatus Bathyarchaeota archaeon]|nr:diphthine synthase [Chloroflexota bacterium]MCL5877138.1 diphthine synthase [Candidatus Bathyarchaeota archaeon]